MPKFETKKVEEINSDELVEELFIDGIGQLDKFREELSRTTFETELDSLILFIEHFANGGHPGKKMKVLKNPTPGGIEFEFISKHLRLYAIQQPNKKLIVFGGKKKAADSSDIIEKFRLVKSKYIDFLNSKK